jgi:hypothetical protein
MGLQAAVHLGHMPCVLTKEEEEEELHNFQNVVHISEETTLRALTTVFSSDTFTEEFISSKML